MSQVRGIVFRPVFPDPLFQHAGLLARDGRSPVHHRKTGHRHRLFFDYPFDFRQRRLIHFAAAAQRIVHSAQIGMPVTERDVFPDHPFGDRERGGERQVRMFAVAHQAPSVFENGQSLPLARQIGRRGRVGKMIGRACNDDEDTGTGQYFRK